MITTIICLVLVGLLFRFAYVRNRKWRPEDFMRGLGKIMKKP